MCYKSPGPRCSSHAAKKITQLKTSHDKVIAQFRDSYNAYQGAIETYKAIPQEETGTKESKVMLAEALECKATALGLKKKVLASEEEQRLAQRDYDGTRKGQKELQEQLNNFDKKNGDFDEFAQLSNRKTASHMLYSWRKNQLKLQQEEETTGKSLKERRGKFLTLADRDVDNDVTEMDDETFQAVINMGMKRQSVAV